MGSSDVQHPSPGGGGESRLELTDDETKRLDGKAVPEPEIVSEECTARASIGRPPGIEEIACAVNSERGEDTNFDNPESLGRAQGSSPRESCREEIKTFSSQHRFVTSSEIVDAPGEINVDVDVECVWSLLALASSLYRKFRSTGAVCDISEAITTLKRAVEITPQDSENLPHMLGNLGSYLQERFRRTGNLSDMTESISILQKAVDMTSDRGATPYSLFNNLGNAYQNLFHRTGGLSNLSKAILLQKQAVDLTPDGHPHLPTMLDNLGRAVHSRFQHTGTLSDLVEAVSIQEKAVRLTPEGHPQLPSRLNDLGKSFHSRSQHADSLSDLNKAISLQRESVHLSPEGDEDLTTSLSALAYSLHSLFERTGCLSDLTEAVVLQGKAVHLTLEGDTNMPTQLNSLGGFLSTRFERTGALSDLTEAIALQKEAIRLTPKGHPGLPSLLNNVGNRLLDLSVRTGDLSDLAEAISLQRQALHLTPEGHPLRPSRLNNLGGSLRHQFERIEALPTLTEAISLQNQAVDLTPKGHPDLPTWLTNLGNSYSRLFEKTADLEAVEAGLSVQRRALQSIPEGHAFLPEPLYQLAQLSYKHFRIKHLPEHLDAAISNFRASATSVSGSPQPRIRAAKRWARVLNQHHPSSVEVRTAFETVIRLLALIAGLEQTVQHRYDMLEEHPGLTLEAAATMFRLELPEKALEWLEQGRCLVWGQQSQLRTPLEELRIHDAVLADRILDVSRRLENAGSAPRASKIDMSMPEKISLEEAAANHLKLATEWEDLLATVRATPGCESFLQPQAFSTLVQHLPKSGPVVIVNIHESRCDAIAILAGLTEPLHIPLPHFSLEKAKKYRKDLNTHLRRQNLRMRGSEDSEGIHQGHEGPYGETRDASANSEGPGREEDVPSRAGGLFRRRSDGLRDVLQGLWVQVVKPILDALAISKADDPSSDALPRIWWCPTGPLSFLPLHAAGKYGGLDSECLLDYAVSSYTPNISALNRRVKYEHPIDPAVSGIFLTSQPQPLGAANIPGTTKEVASVYNGALEHCCRALKLVGDAVNPEGCLKHMEEFSCIHLACHGSHDAGDPLQSRFLFHNGGRLSLSDISQRNLKNADLAFLSACETSTGQETLSDEAVHLAAGMLAAGYRRVVATMWAIGDGNAPQVANDFYDYLWTHSEEGSGTRFDGTLSAYALHHAIQRLRGRLENSDASLLAWIPYVHYGY